MSFTVFHHNVNERIGHPDAQQAVFEHLKRQVGERPAIGVLTEVCREKPLPAEESQGALADFADREGYKLYWTDYADTTLRVNQPPDTAQYLAILSRYETPHLIEDPRLWLATRNALTLTVDYQGLKVNVTGAHFDDRSHQTRFQQAQAYAQHLRNIEEERATDVAIFAVDANEMHASPLRTLAIRGLYYATAWYAPGQPPEGPVEPPPGAGLRAQLIYKACRGKSVFERAAQFVKPQGLAFLEQNGLQDIGDGKLTHRLGQLDHILYATLGAARTAEITYRRAGTGPSDHELLSLYHLTLSRKVYCPVAKSVN